MAATKFIDNIDQYKKVSIDLDTFGRYSRIVTSCRSWQSWRYRTPPESGWPAAAAAPARPVQQHKNAIVNNTQQAFLTQVIVQNTA